VKPIPNAFRHAFFTFFVVLAGGCFQQCSFFSGAGLRIADTNFGSTVDLAQNLTFTFNQAVLADEQLAQSTAWVQTQYIDFKPAIAGSYRWADTRTLVFSPAVPLLPSTRYEARLTTQLTYLNARTQGQSIDLEPLTFSTPEVSVTAIESYWASGAENQPEPRLKLTCNYPVNPADLASKLAVRAESQVKPRLKSLTAEPQTALRFTLEGLLPKPGQELTVPCEIARDLRPVNGQLGASASIPVSVYLPDPAQLYILGVRQEMLNGETVIKVALSQQPVGQFNLSIVTANYWDQQPVTGWTTSVEENNIVIRGNFPEDQSLQVQLKKGLRGVAGGILENDESRTVDFTKPPRTLSFASARALYLANSGARLVELYINGIDEVDVKIAKIYENNLAAFLRSSSLYDLNTEFGGSDYRYYDITSYGDVVYEKTMPVASMMKENGKHRFHLKFPDSRESYKGIYVVELTDKNEKWVRATRVITISDLGLAVQGHNKSYSVWAHNLSTAEPQSGARITLLSSNNQTIATATTDGSGLATFTTPGDWNGFKPSLITAAQGADFTYIPIEGSGIETSRFDLSGKPTEGLLYDAFIYGPRTLYRPGETIPFQAVIRTVDDWKKVTNMPVVMVVTAPDGRELTQLTGSLSPTGSWSGQLVTERTAITGEYTFQLYTGAERSQSNRLAGYSVLVEEFKPDQLKINLQTASQTLNPADELSVNLQASTYFGTVAAGNRYEMNLNLGSVPFKAAPYPDYDFTLSGTNEALIVKKDGSTNADGKATDAWKLPAVYKNTGVLQGAVYANVVDNANVPVYRQLPITWHTQAYYVGIKSFDPFVAAGSPVNLPLNAVLPSGQPARATARLKIVRIRYETVLEQSYGSYRYVSQKREEPVMSQDVSLSGPTVHAFTPGFEGEYEIRLSIPGARHYVAKTLYAFGSGGSQVDFGANTDGFIDITANKQAYQVGDDAELLFKTPFDGRLLITVERNKVTERFQVITEGRKARLRLGLKARHLPNVFVSALLIRPMTGTNTPFTVAHGFKNLRVEDPARKIPVLISGPARTLSGKQLSFVIRTAPHAEVTVAAVDEGILALRQTPTPDIYGYFYASRALEVKHYDYYASLFPDIRKTGTLNRKLTGGDMAMLASEMASRQNPFAEKGAALLSRWSAPLKADANGTLTYTLAVPSFAGEVRIMAVAHANDRFGSGQHSLTVSDPVVFETNIPSFISPDDTVEAVLSFSNTTAQSQTASLALASDALTLIGNPNVSVSIPAQGRIRQSVQLTAGKSYGVANITTTLAVSGQAEKQVRKFEVSVRPPAGLTFFTQNGGLKTGTHTLKPEANGILPQTVKASLTIGRLPIAQFSRDLSALLQYPHGCVEQTVATAFPQLYYSALAKALSTPLTASAQGSPAANITAALRKLETMQGYSGGLTYWPGQSGEPHEWGSIFAAHFVVEAKKAGYQVSEDFYQKLLTFVRGTPNRSGSSSWYMRGSERVQLTRPEVAYSLFVLALAGEKPVAAINAYRSRIQQFTPESRYLLAAAGAILGDASATTSLLPTEVPDFSTVAPEKAGTLESTGRTEALALYALTVAAPQHPHIPLLVRRVSEGLKQQDCELRSTQHQVFALLGLGRFAQQQGVNTATATISQNGKVLAMVKDEDTRISLGTGPVTIQVSGQGQLYYTLVTQGVPTDPVPQALANNLEIKRVYKTEAGQLANLDNLEVGQVVAVELTVRPFFDDGLEYVVLTDLLPAGFSIENPRLHEQPPLPWMNGATTPTFLDIRSDRVHYFMNDLKGTQRFIYTMRAVAPGKFIAGGASAEAMYQPTYRARTSPSYLRVKPRREPATRLTQR
jgi:uncharacterized protein YfaS (alpha-2-macroglobulin family)